MINRRSVFFPFLALLVFVISVGCLCTGLTNKVTETEVPAQPPTEAPVQLPPTKVPPTEVPATEAPVTEAPVSNNSSGGWTTFTDENGFYAIDVPSDWEYSHTVDDESNNYYIDTFSSPDGGAVIENIVYNDGTPFTSGQNGQFALQILNQLYSKTGREGDIRVSDDRIMKDGSERLTWTSKEGLYSGISYFEVRDRNWFLMFTVNWGNAVQDEYFDTLNTVIESYRTP
jgi:hypothetical protein